MPTNLFHNRAKKCLLAVGYNLSRQYWSFLVRTVIFVRKLTLYLETVLFFLRFIQQILDDPSLTNV